MRAFGLLLAAAGLLPGATLLSLSRDGNSVFLRLSDGSAGIEWLSESSFRFSRTWSGEIPSGPPANPQPIALNISETPESISIAAKYVVVTVTKQGILVKTTDSRGATLMADASEVERRDGVIAWERLAPAEARFFGMGAREDSRVELRGARVAALKPFLMTTVGYGELHVAPGKYTFDVALAKPDRYRIEARGADAVDYYFFYGPSQKEIFEQLLILNGPIAWLSPSEFDLLKPSAVPAAATLLSKPSLLDTVHSFINSSLSGAILAAMSIDGSQSRRAIQLGSVTPIVLGSKADAMRGTIRGELTPYLTTYAQEARERGIPLLRALPMQFSRDADAAQVSDQFMLGDELLVAPVLDDQTMRKVYLPMGIWTRLGNNQVYQGRTTITIDAPSDELPLFSRNGAILPLGSDPMRLHYFPKLGGEFFLFESDLGEYSQVHAGPAGDFMRLEIESKKDRDYEWIVHHLDKPLKITAGDSLYAPVGSRDRLRPGAWFYDARDKNLHVRARGPAHVDVIINISF